ncbi:uncharacterized protein B4U79_03719, partial [Dinothrombium tinctorium]
PSVNGIFGGRSVVPCNISVPFDDSVILILWYKDDTTGAPIYSVDGRFSEGLVNAEHFQSKSLENRAIFEISSLPPSLIIDSTKEEDDGLYFCRMDFKWSRTIIKSIFLNVVGELTSSCSESMHLVPPHKLLITNENGVQFRSTAGPFNEGEDAMLQCIVKGVKPLSVQIANSGKHLLAGKQIEIICQTHGSRPPAQITWTLAGKVIPHSREAYSEEGNVSTSVLELIPTAENNASLLVCKSENHRFVNSSLEDSWTLNILYKPFVQLSTANAVQKRKLISLQEESSLKLECLINANPSPTDRRWFFNEQQLQNDTSIQGTIAIILL